MVVLVVLVVVVVVDPEAWQTGRADKARHDMLWTGRPAIDVPSLVLVSLMCLAADIMSVA